MIKLDSLSWPSALQRQPTSTWLLRRRVRFDCTGSWAAFISELLDAENYGG